MEVPFLLIGISVFGFDVMGFMNIMYFMDGDTLAKTRREDVFERGFVFA
jgi:hypothetical protein